ncbi:endonuclease/exonuclease/phosphatase family protein [Propionibacteriaceae bacterium Y2011]
MRVVLVLLALPPLALGAGLVALRVVPDLQQWSGLAMVASFVPYGVAAWLVAALLALLATATSVRRHGWRRSRAATVVAATTVAGLVLQLSWLAPDLVPDRPARPNGPTVTVVTLNLFVGRADPDQVMAALAGADVVMLVEVTPEAEAALDARGLAERLPHRVGRSEPGVNGSLLLSRYPLGEHAQIESTYQQWWALVDVPRWGATTFAVVHPTNPPDSTSRWFAENEAVRTALRPRVGGPAVIAGDFNATTDHVTMRKFSADGWRTSRDLAGAGHLPTWPAAGTVDLAGIPVPPMITIDHVLLSPRLTAVGHETFVVPGTDHHGVRTELALAP